MNAGDRLRNIAWATILAVTLAVAVTMGSSSVAQTIIRIYGTVSGAPIALKADSSGRLIVTASGSPTFTGPVLTADSTCAAPTFSYTSEPTTGDVHVNGDTGFYGCVSGTSIQRWATTGLVMKSDMLIGWSSGASNLSPDTSMTRSAVSNLTLTGTNAVDSKFIVTNSGQFNAVFRASNTTAAASGSPSTQWQKTNNSANARIGDVVFNASGAAGLMSFRFLNDAENSATTWLSAIGTSSAITSVSWTGHLLASADNTYDFGASGATRARTGYFGTSVVTPILQGSGTGVTVANVGANSCGTTAATIAGNQISGVITVGATAGTQCRVTFSTAAPTARDCTVTDSTTTIATRATVVSTTTHDFLGAFVAGDNVTYQCTVR